MATTVLEALENAQINFDTIGRMGASGNPIFIIAQMQLKNAIESLRNNRSADFVIQDSLLDEVKT